ncbi:MAG TPA: hypothetical protein VH475_01640 [Tepidisphaeraceae bacterium]
MRTVYVIALLTLSVAPRARCADTEFDRYIWQTPRTSDPARASAPMIDELRSEIQKVLDAGPLAPLRAVYADLLQDPYFLYWQPGRIITTLSAAYPHLTPGQQAAVRRYVRAELDDPRRAPWCAKGFLPPDQGARRELHTFNQPLGWDRYWGMWGRHKPVMGSFYGLWLYADRTGDWDAIKADYPDIVRLYQARRDQCDIYGTMGAPIAMARIARHMGDDATAKSAEQDAHAALELGKDIVKVEDRAKRYWKERYEPRQRRLVYNGWIVLDLCPEVGRFVHDQVKDDVLARHADALRRYPLFWLREVPYWSRWTGDEGLGIPTELMGMIVPVERWVADAPPARLASYTKSAPICLGDCYWIEMLINAIESTGNTQWVDLKDAPTVDAQLGDFEAQADVGTVEPPGSATFDKSTGQYRITSAGANIWGAHDDFHFVYRKSAGDVVLLTADIAWVGQGKNAHRKAGCMIRQSLDPDSPYADIMIHGDGLISLQYRESKGGQTKEIKSETKAPAAIRLERRGDTFTAFVAPKKDGKPGEFHSVGSIKLALGEPAYAGLAVSSHEPKDQETAVFTRVAVESLGKGK